MNIEDIQKFLDTKISTDNAHVRIAFKKRDAIDGMFVQDYRDYSELKAKNFWRIVPRSQFTAYKKTKDVNLARIFSGSDFSRLTIAKETVE
jgi:hypothetical protein